jgi:hypothetical protein
LGKGAISCLNIMPDTTTLEALSSAAQENVRKSGPSKEQQTFAFA